MDRLKQDIMVGRIITKRAGFSPSKTVSAIVKRLNNNIYLFNRCDDNFGLNYCLINDTRVVDFIENSGIPLSYFFYPDEFETAKQLVVLIKKFNSILSTHNLEYKRGENTHVPNPLSGDTKAIGKGATIYKDNCAVCHGASGKGGIGPSLVDNKFLYSDGDVSDGSYFDIINKGTQPGLVVEGHVAKGGMPPFGTTLDNNKIWSLVSFIKSIRR